VSKRDMRNPAVTGAIRLVDRRNAKQVEANVGAADLYFTDEEIEGRNDKESELATAA
jgi:hypothetical protein